MKTVKQVWVLSSGPGFQMVFEDRVKALAQLSDQEFLESIPDQTLLKVQPAYLVVSFEVPGTEYWRDGGPKPLQITHQATESVQ